MYIFLIVCCSCYTPSNLFLSVSSVLFSMLPNLKFTSFRSSVQDCCFFPLRKSNWLLCFTVAFLLSFFFFPLNTLIRCKMFLSRFLHQMTLNHQIVLLNDTSNLPEFYCSCSSDIFADGWWGSYNSAPQRNFVHFTSVLIIPIT